MQLKDFDLDACYRIRHSIEHHNLHIYLDVESLTVAFFSLIDDIESSLQ
jgi:hypothetical protein